MHAIHRNIMVMLVLIIAPTLSFAQTPEKDFKKRSVEELAKDLANPNTPLTSLWLKTQFRTYAGELNGSGSQAGTLTLLQPTLPFPLANGNKIWIRPGIPYHFQQPYYNENGFESISGLGDIVIDFQYGGNLGSGYLWSVGASTTIPSASKADIGIEQWALGPGMQLGYVSKKTVLAVFINHQTGLGNGSKKYNTTTLQFFAIYLPTGGWNVGSVPIVTYNAESDSWGVPLNISFGRTIKINERPWKRTVELNYYIEQNSLFGPKSMLGINFAPVVENIIADWL